MTHEHITAQANRILAEVDELTDACHDFRLLRRLAAEAIWDWWYTTPGVQARAAHLALRHIHAEVDRREAMR